MASRDSQTPLQTERKHGQRNPRTKRKREAASSSAMAAAENLDVVQEILLRLPESSVARFRCVCREWRDLTMSPYLVVAYTRRRPLRASGVFLRDMSPHSYSTYRSTLDGSPVFPEPRGFDHFGDVILQTCNGLILGEHTRSEEEGGGPDRSNFWVYNPMTRQRRILRNFASDRCRDLVLAFDPWRSVSYSVVVLRYHPDEILAYRSQTDSWHTIFSEDPWIGSLGLYYCFCDGVVCWFTRDGFLFSIDVERRSVTKTATSCFPRVDGNYSISYCGQSRGRLRLIRSHVDGNSRNESFNPLDPSATLEVVELASDRSTWLLLHRVPIRDVYKEMFCRTRWMWNSSVTSREFKRSIYRGIRHCCLVEGKGEHDEIMLAVATLVPCTTTLAAP